MVKRKGIKIDKLCRKANELDFQRFKHEILSHLNWYNIPKHWKMTDLQEFYNRHKEESK